MTNAPLNLEVQRLRKSKPLSNDWAAGNGAKYLSYREAWARIKLACKQGYYLEAVTIEESIVADRMLSYLEKTCHLDLPSGTKNILSNLITRWQKEAIARSFSSEDVAVIRDLHERINAWRTHRNRVVHGMVKSAAGKGEDHIEGFLTGAKSAAIEGHEIARLFSTWVTKAKKRGDLNRDASPHPRKL